MTSQPEGAGETISSILLQPGRATQGTPQDCDRETVDREVQNCKSRCKHGSPRQGWQVSAPSGADSDKPSLPGPLRGEGFGEGFGD